MAKISIKCRLLGLKCGCFCAAKFALLMATTYYYPCSNTLAQSISLPTPPVASPPPLIPREQDPAVIRSQQKREAEQIEEQIQKEESANKADTVAKETAKSEARAPRPLYGFFELSLLWPKAVVSSGRKNYELDFTAHANSYFRVFASEKPETSQLWLGLRVATFGGYGTQGVRTSRFAHTWLGPAIGIGAIHLPSDPQSDFPTRTGWLLSCGIAGIQRMVARDESAPPLPTDFSPTPWTIDPPGVWSEARWYRITHGAIGIGILAGAQTGTGKIFYYAGITTNGFI